MKNKFLLFLSVVFLGIGQIWGQTYELVTSDTQLEEGAEYLILGKRSNNTILVMTTTQNSNNRAGVVISGTTLPTTLEAETNYAVFELGLSDGHWTFYDAENEGFLYAASSSSNHLRTRANDSDGNSRWEINIDNDNNIASVVAQGANSRKVMQLNNANNQDLFACYGSASQAPVYLYKKGVASTDPILNASETEITGLGYMEGNTPASQSFSLSGMNLEPTSGNITVTAPANFQVSTDDVNFSNSLNISYSGGTLASTDVYVRLNESLAINTYNGNITISGGGASDAIVSVEGIVTEFSEECGFENFDNAELTGSYADGSFVGNNGVVWSYVNARNEGDYPIIGGGLIFQKSGDNLSATVSNGVGTLTFQARKAFTGSSNNRQLALYINDELEYTTPTFGTSGTDTTIHTFTVENINVEGDVTIKIQNAGAQVTIDNISWTCYSSTPTPQISVTPSGNHDFGNQLVGSTSTPETFTIENTGNADLTIGTITLSGADAGEFSVTQASSPVTQGNSTTFTVSFSPTSLGSKTATVTIPNNDENYTFTVTGNGSNSASSDIATNTDFTYTNNILYANYQTPTITSTSNSVGVFQFAVRDGGGDNDGDDKPTTLTDIAFNYTGSANTIRAAALFNVNGKIADGVVSANGISFSGLNIVAPDNDSSPNITLRVSFTQTVTDKEKLVFTVASATADTSGSVFAQANAGGAFSDNNNGNNRNRIEVVADRLAYATQPSGTSVNTNLDAFVIAGVDEFGNTDADATNSITLTTSGTGMTASPSYTLSNGTVSISDVQFNTSQTGITLTATTTGLVSGNTVTSEPFDISDLATGTYRTTSNGTWPSGATPATWEILTAGGWNPATPSSNTTDLLIIRHTVTSSGSFSATGGVGTKMLVENGGTFNAGHNSTFGTLTVQNGGVFSVDNPAVTVTTDGNLTVENGGRLIFNSSTLDSEDGLFRGTENFHPESILEIKNWHFNAGSGRQNLIQSNSTYYVTPNSAGYHFGHIEVNAPSMSRTLGVIQNTLSGSTVNLCNDFRVLTNADRVILVNSGTNTVIGGNLLVNTAPSSQFSFAANTASNATHTVKGNIVIESGVVDLNQTSSANGGNVVVQLQGNLVVNNSGVLQNTDSGDVNTMLNFTGNGTEQTVSTASESTITSIPFNINSGASVKIINHDFKLGNNSKLTVKTGGTLDFGFNGSTALNVAGYGNTGTGFTSEAGSYLKISSPQGIVSTSGSVGNIQTNTAPNISTLGTFHYIGKANQVTGNGIGTSSTGRAVIVDMESDALVLTPSVSFGITNNANTHINNNNGGVLDIRKGRFVETETEYVTGSTGSLKMDAGTYYEVVKATATEGTSDYIPRISGTYELNGGEINLASTGNQTLRGGRSYFDLTFSQGGEKGISSTIANIAGTVTIKDHTILDVGNTTFGGTPTHLVMEDTAMFIVNGGDTKPNMGGSYTLASGTTIDFTGSSATQIRVAPDYANVIVSGTNVTAGGTDAAGLTFQNGGSFTVKDGATFKVNNPAGFTGSTTASIKNAEVLAAITLEPNSTIEYNGSGAQTITNGIVTTPSDAHYENLRISGSGVKTTALGNLIVNEITYVDAATLRVAETNDDVAPNVLTARKGIEVEEGATALFENNANLMQDADAENSGDITVERFVQDMNNDMETQMDYVYWSSPVEEQSIQTFSPASQYKLWYNESNDYFYYIPSTEPNFIPAKGYAFSAENDKDDGYDETYQFIGTPQNDVITIPIKRSPDSVIDGITYKHGSNLVGNPYPSTIDAGLFHELNKDKIDFHFEFWTNESYTPEQQGSGYSGYSKNNYAILTEAGLAPPSENQATYNFENENTIKIGQGFIVKKTVIGEPVDLVFNNSIRLPESGHFYHRNNLNNEKDRFWLTFISPNQMLNTALIGYFPNATDDFDRNFDALSPVSSDAIFTLLGEEKLGIQGLEYPLEITDEIPLGVKSHTQGVGSIYLRRAEGIFENAQTIYLRDKYEDLIHNLSEGPYEFELEEGETLDRFEIIFQEDEVMSTSDLLDNPIKIYHTDQSIVIESEKEKILSVEVYDLNGRKVHSKDRINSSLYQIRKTSLATQVFVVKVLTDGGKVETRKIINQ